MSNLFVVAFNDDQGADRLLNALGGWQKQNLIKVDDAAVLVRRQDGKAKIRQAHNLVGAGALGGAFWGMLIGLLFLAPWLGLAIGAGLGAMGGKMANAGVDKKFIDEVSNSIPVGGSALFAYTREAVVDKILPQLGQFHGKLIQASLSSEQEAQLRDAFGAEDLQTAGMK
jgi:uncharacterized membrane protein